MAIALAIRQGRETGESLTILSDSQSACRNFQRGKLSKVAHQILSSTSEPTKQYTQTLVWIPGHAGITGNLYADRVARGHATYRAPNSLGTEDLIPLDPDYTTILQHYRGLRKVYPEPHKKLSNEEAIDLRRLQTGTFINLHILHMMHPTTFRDECPWCGKTPTLYHITWECSSHQLQKIENPNERQWEALLASSDPEAQLYLVTRARKLAKASGALDWGRQPLVSLG